MQISLALEGEKANRKIEVRTYSPDGPLVGKLDLSNSGSGLFTKKTIALSCSGEPGFRTIIPFYLVYEGDEGAVKINWIYVTSKVAKQIPVPPLEPDPVIGDLDGDDKFTSIDFMLLKRYLLDIDVDVPMDYWLEAGDVDGDGQLNSIDFILFKKRLLDLIDKFPIEIKESETPEVNYK